LARFPESYGNGCVRWEGGAGGGDARDAAAGGTRAVGAGLGCICKAAASSGRSVRGSRLAHAVVPASASRARSNDPGGPYGAVSMGETAASSLCSGSCVQFLLWRARLAEGDTCAVHSCQCQPLLPQVRAAPSVAQRTGFGSGLGTDTAPDGVGYHQLSQAPLTHTHAVPPGGASSCSNRLR
jgi:hypothetical protein